MKKLFVLVVAFTLLTTAQSIAIDQCDNDSDCNAGEECKWVAAIGVDGVLSDVSGKRCVPAEGPRVLNELLSPSCPLGYRKILDRCVICSNCSFSPTPQAFLDTFAPPIPLPTFVQQPYYRIPSLTPPSTLVQQSPRFPSLLRQAWFARTNPFSPFSSSLPNYRPCET